MYKRFIVYLAVGITMQIVAMISMFHIGYKYAEDKILDSMRQDVIAMEIGECFTGRLDIDNSIEVEITRVN